MPKSFVGLMLFTGTVSAETPKITVGGYVEAYYQLHFQHPDNRITSLRGFDNRSQTFTLSNVAVDVTGEQGPVTGHVVLQIGHTPSTYFLAEPDLPGSLDVDATSDELWKYLQTATLAVKAPHALTVEVGLVLSPIGPEGMAIKDNWNWSRSNSFLGLPAYHTGVTVSRPLGGAWTGKLHVYNGWNSVTDNNGTPSVAVSALYKTDKVLAQVLYFGGNEWPSDAPEGSPWRNLGDAYLQYGFTDDISAMAYVDAGVEWNNFGTSSWFTAALYGRFALTSSLFIALRGDVFYADTPAGASPIFWPTDWMASGTATVAYQPVAGTSIRIEYRHDQATSDVFFGGDVVGDGVVVPYEFDREAQDTLTLGATAWF